MKTRSKVVTDIELVEYLESKFGIRAVGSTEDFNGSQGGIWLSAENGEQYQSRDIFDYYSVDHKNYDIGVLKSFEKAMDQVGWYAEWNDPGTIMLWKI